MLYDSSDAAGAAAGMSFIVVILWLLFSLAILALEVYLYMRVAGKAGFPKTYGLLPFIPLAGIVFVIMFVFQEWPVERQLREVQQGRGGMLPPGTPQYAVPGAGGYQAPQGGYPAAQGGYPAPQGGYSAPQPPPAPAWPGQQGPTQAPTPYPQPGAPVPYDKPGTPDPYGQPGGSGPYGQPGGR